MLTSFPSILACSLKAPAPAPAPAAAAAAAAARAAAAAAAVARVYFKMAAANTRFGLQWRIGNARAAVAGLNSVVHVVTLELLVIRGSGASVSYLQ